MRRSLCGIVILSAAWCLCGCPKKQPLPEAAVPSPQAPAPPAESNTPEPPARPEHPVVAATRAFLKYLAAGDTNRALAQVVPGEITRQSLDGMRVAFQWDKATFAQVWVGTEQAAVITNPVPIKDGEAGLSWAFNLIVTEDGHWLVRLADVLRSPQDAEDYLAGLRAVAPEAKAIEL